MKSNLEEQLTLSLPDVSKLNALKEKFFENINQLNSKQILYYINKNDRQYTQEEKKLIFDRLENNKDLGATLALQVLDQKLGLNKEDYSRIFHQRANPQNKKVNDNQVIDQYRVIYAGLTKGIYSQKAFEACQECIQELYGNSIQMYARVARPLISDLDKLQGIKEERIDSIVKNIEKNNIALENYADVITKYGSPKLNERLINENKIPMDFRNLNYEVLKKRILNNQISAVEALGNAIKAGNDTLINNIIREKDLPIEQKITLFDELRNPKKYKKDAPSLNAEFNPKRAFQFNNWDSLEANPSLDPIPLLKVLAENIKNDDKFAFADISQLTKINFLNLLITENHDKQKVAASKEMRELSDQLIEKHIEISSKIEPNIINYLVDNRDIPNFELLDKALVNNKNVIPDEHAMASLSKGAKGGYLDKYIEKCLACSDKEMQRAILDSKFKHEFFGEISVDNYQKTRKEFLENIKEKNIEKLVDFAKTSLNLWEYTLVHLKDNPEMFINVFSKALPNPKNSQEFKKAIIQLTEIAKTTPEGKLVFGEVLNKANIKKQDFINKWFQREDQNYYSKIIDEFKPYNQGIDSINSQVKITAINHYLEETKGKNISAAVQIIKRVTNLDEQKPLLVSAIKEVCKKGKDTQAIEKLGELLGSDKMRNAEIILEATHGMKLSNNVKSGLDKVYNDKVRGGTNESELQDFDKLMQAMNHKDFGKLIFSEEISKSSKQKLPENLDKEHLAPFKEAAKTLKSNLKGENVISGLTDNQRHSASQNLLQNLSREQMTYVTEAMKAYENYSQKNWLSKSLSNFADAIKKAFSKKIDNEIVKAGIKEIIESGVKIGNKAKTQQLDNKGLSI